MAEKLQTIIEGMVAGGEPILVNHQKFITVLDYTKAEDDQLDICAEIVGTSRRVLIDAENNEYRELTDPELRERIEQKIEMNSGWGSRSQIITATKYHTLADTVKLNEGGASVVIDITGAATLDQLKLISTQLNGGVGVLYRKIPSEDGTFRMDGDLGEGFDQGNFADIVGGI